MRPASQRWIVVTRAELVQAGAAVQVACGELPGVVQAALLLLTDDGAVGVIDVAIDIIASAVRHAHNRAQPVEEVVILLAIGRALVIQEPTATAPEVGGATGIRACRESQPRIHEGVRIDLHPVRLIGPTIGVGVAADVGGLVLGIIREGWAPCIAGQVAVAVVTVGGGRATAQLFALQFVASRIAVGVRDIWLTWPLEQVCFTIARIIVGIGIVSQRVSCIRFVRIGELILRAITKAA